jgi:hypothetical protein
MLKKRAGPSQDDRSDYGGVVMRSGCNKELIPHESTRKSATRLVVSKELLVSRESLNAMIGDGLARIFAAHIGKNLFHKAIRTNRSDQ